MIHGRGFLTEYASELSALANEDGANIAILTDFDDSGITIALQMPNVPRIGIDFNTLEELGISERLEELEEMYKPGKHLTHIKNEHPEIRNLEYLEEKRIEINAVRNYVGSERLWEWIVFKLEELFPNRDYNRAIDMSAAFNFVPLPLQKLHNIVEGKIVGVLTPLIKRYKLSLSRYPGFMDNISQYENDLFEKLQDKIYKDRDIGSVMKDISKMVNKYNGHGNARA